MAYNATKWVAEYGNVEVDGKRLQLQAVLEETWLPLLQ
jgi:hypothetical protein